MTIKQCIIAIVTLPFLNNWIWEMFYKKQIIQWNYYINALKILIAYNTTKDHYTFWAGCVFIRKFAAAKKSRKQITPCLLNQHVFY